MKSLKLLSLKLQNFKGARDIQVIFSDETNIFGANESGKSTIFDAFWWLLFGKDSAGRSDFELKTLDSNNVVIPKIEHSVEGELFFDRVPINLKRIAREKWVKKRGAEISEFTGNETIYFIDDVPMSQKEYQSKISAILDETIFKLITSPSAFNALKWDERRRILIDMVGEVDDFEILGQIEGSEKLHSLLSERKSIADYKKQVAASIKKSKDELALIPTRIDEVIRSKPQITDLEIRQAETNIEQFQAQVDSIDSQIQDKSKAVDTVINALNIDKGKLVVLENHIQKIESDIRKEIEDKDRKSLDEVQNKKTALERQKTRKKHLEDSIANSKSDFTQLKLDIDKIDQELVSLRTEYSTEQAKTITIDENSICCPTCLRTLDSEGIEAKKKELIANFEQAKAKKLLEINTTGKQKAEQKKLKQDKYNQTDWNLLSIKDELKQQAESIEKLESELSIPTEVISKEMKFTEQLGKHENYLQIVEQADTLRAKIDNYPIVAPDIESLKTKRLEAIAKIDENKKMTRQGEMIKSCDFRIDQLKTEERKLAAAIADQERDQFVIEKFNKLKITGLETKINELFTYVKFKMFETQINGGEIETCVCLINGVPYSDANTAAKVNAGIDIINALCKKHQITAPVFVDNRETTTNLLPSESQIINLIVSPTDKALRVENK